MPGHIPKTFIQDLLSRADIVSIIETRIALKKAGSNFQACCPFHQEKTPSFTVSPGKQFYHCFGCGANGNAIGFLMAYDRLTFVEAVEALAKQLGVEVPYENIGKPKKEGEANLDSLYDLLLKIAEYYHAELMKNPKAVQYLKERGLTKTAVRQFLIGYAPNAWDNVLSRFGTDSDKQDRLQVAGMIIHGDRQNYYDRFRDRIMFPIRDRRGRVIGFGGRIINPQDTPKYLNSPETPIFHKGSELYGWYEVMQNHHHLKRALVVEGYMDVVGLAQKGVNYAMATLGTATSAEHIQRLFRLTKTVVFCFDGDQAGFSAAWRALEVLSPLIQDDWQPKFMFLPEGEDPDTFIQKVGKEGFEIAMQEAKTFSEYFFSYLTQKLDLLKIDNRASFANQAFQYLRKMPANITREMLVQKLSKMVNLTVEKLAQYLDEGDDASARGEGEKLAEKFSFEHFTKKSPARVAITLLLQYPDLVLLADDQELSSVEVQGVSLFKEIVSFIRNVKETLEESRVTTAMILENWRDEEEVRHLSRLAMIDIMLSEQAAEAEFKGALNQLKQQSARQQIERFMVKASLGTLSDEEKAELQRLLLRKQK